MTTIRESIAKLEDIRTRAEARPCTRDELVRLEEERRKGIEQVRTERELLRESVILGPEPLEWRKAMQAAGEAIRMAVAEHEAAEAELRRLEGMVHRGHLHEAATERTKVQVATKFPDLNLDFVDQAITKQGDRERKLVTAGVCVAVVVLMVVALIEWMKRSQLNIP